MPLVELKFLDKSYELDVDDPERVIYLTQKIESKVARLPKCNSRDQLLFLNALIAEDSLEELSAKKDLPEESEVSNKMISSLINVINDASSRIEELAQRVEND